jgi:2-aminoadipate transaminase
VPFGPEGFDPDALGRIIANEQPRLTVVTPNFQNPTGFTMSEEARRAVLACTRRAGSVLVESDIYTRLRYKGQDVPPIKRLDPSGDTILIGSYSKVAFPGLRVGWVIGPSEVIAQLAECKQWADLHTDQLSQAVLLRFVESGFLEEHRRRVVREGSERLNAALSACRNATYTRPEGGMNLWVRLPEPLDAGELAPRASREGVSYMPGKHFAVSRPESGALRLSFAGLKPAEIREGIAILGRIFTKEIERVGAGSRCDSSPALV